MIEVRTHTDDFGGMSQNDAGNHYLKTQGYRVLQTGDCYWRLITVLLFWDAIYARIDSAVNTDDPLDYDFISTDDPRFEERFRTILHETGAPRDFKSPDFFESRAEFIITRYKALRTANLQDEIKSQYKQHKGKPCMWIQDWDRYTLEELLLPIAHLKTESVLRITFRVLQNITVQGLPNHFAYKEGEILWVYPKRYRDKITSDHILWAQFFSLITSTKILFLLIDESPRKVTLLQKKLALLSDAVSIKFGKSGSAKYRETVAFFKQLPTYSHWHHYHSAKFTLFTEQLLTALNGTTRWKNLTITVHGDETTSTTIRNAYRCLEQHTKYWSLDDQLYNKTSRYGCVHNVSPFLTNEWSEYGMIDHKTGVWSLNREQLHSEADTIISEHRYCPFFDYERLRHDIKHFPDQIDPRNDPEWAYIDAEGREWLYREGKFIAFFSDLPFPGSNEMIGVKNIREELKFYRKTQAILAGSKKEIQGNPHIEHEKISLWKKIFDFFKF